MFLWHVQFLLFGEGVGGVVGGGIFISRHTNVAESDRNTESKSEHQLARNMHLIYLTDRIAPCISQQSIPEYFLQQNRVALDMNGCAVFILVYS